MITPLAAAVPATFWAESASQMSQDWRVVAIGVGGGLIALYMKQRGGARENTVTEIKQQSDATAGAVKEIKEQVVNDHDTNMRDDLTEGLELMRVAVSYIRTLPTSDQYKELSRRLEAIEQGRAPRS